MKLKKITAFLLIACILAPCTSYAHGTKKTDDNSNSENESEIVSNASGLDAFKMPEKLNETEKINLTFWAKNDSNISQKNIYKKAIAAFQELYPNVTIDLRSFTDYGQIYNEVITNIATNTTPNICITYPDHIATYLTGKNIVAPLDEMISNSQYGLGGTDNRFDTVEKDELIERFFNEGVFSGYTYAIPFMRSTEACYINKTFVEKLGYTVPDILTWDFIWEVSEAAMKKDENGLFMINGQKVMIPFIYKSTDNMMISMLKQQNGGYSDEKGNILIFNDKTREILSSVAEHARTKSFSTFKISSYPGNFLNAGQCIFAIDSTAGSTWMGSKAPLMDISAENVVDFETVVRPIPQYDINNPQMISQGPSLCIFNKKNPQEVLASWLFVQYLLTNDIQIPYSQTEGYIPVTYRALNSDEYNDYISRSGEDNNKYYDIKIAATKLLQSNIGNTFVTPVFVGSASLRDAAGQLIEETVKSERRGEQVNNEFFDALENNITSLYRLNSIGSLNKNKADLGRLPNQSIVLICVIVSIWIVLIVIEVIRAVKEKKKNSV